MGPFPTISKCQLSLHLFPKLHLIVLRILLLLSLATVFSTLQLGKSDVTFFARPLLHPTSIRHWLSKWSFTFPAALLSVDIIASCFPFSRCTLPARHHTCSALPPWDFLYSLHLTEILAIVCVCLSHSFPDSVG